MFNTVFSNLAPEQTRKENKFQISIVHAKASTYMLDIYLKAKGIKNETEKLDIAIKKSNEEVIKWFHEQEIIPDTWRKFKARLIKHSSEQTMKNLLIFKHDFEEKTHKWLERILNMLEGSTLSLEEGKFWIYQTAATQQARKFVKFYIESCNSYSEMKTCLNQIKQEENMIGKNTVETRVITKTINSKPEIRVKEEPINKKYLNQIDKESTIKNDDKCWLMGTEIDLIQDAGSEVNIISAETARKHGCFKQKIPHITLYNVFGKITNIDEETSATITINNILITAKFLVAEIENENLILIGKTLMKEITQRSKEIDCLEKNFEVLFSSTASPGYEGVWCDIQTKKGAKTKAKYRNIPAAEIKKVEKELDILLENNYIEPSNSAWSNPLRIVPKKDRVRITCAMQALNNLVEDDNYTVPKIQEIINNTQGKKFFTVVDMRDGYYQIKLRPEDKHKTAFYFKNRLYQWTRMPQGFKNSPAVFQRVMDCVLQKYIGTKCEVYLDDVIIYGKNEEEHDKNVKEIFETLQSQNFRINREKLQFKTKMAKILGVVIDGVTQSPIAEKQKKILEYKIPQTRKEVERFLGFVGYYRKFIPNMANTAAPLYDLLRKNNSEIIRWTDKHEESFTQLKEIVSKNLTLYIPDVNNDFILKTDASGNGIGAVLQQNTVDGIQPVDWASKKLTDAEKKMGITEREFLAMAWAVEHFEYYLKGKRFEIITDHMALLALKSGLTFKSLKLERMRERLSNYSFDITYIKGKDLIDADALSRVHEEAQEYTDYELKSSKLLSDAKGTRYWKKDDDSIKIIPKIMERKEIIEKTHNEILQHRGCDPTVYEISKTYYWPKLISDTKREIENCETCAKNIQKTDGGCVFINTSKPLDIIGVDIMFINQQQPILTAIDYFSRLAFAKCLHTKSSNEIKDALNEIFHKWGHPKCIISDNGKEFEAKEIKQLLAANDIEHHRISLEKHQSNGRVERLNRTLWQYFRKMEDNTDMDHKQLEDKIKKLITSYNNTFHRAINNTPNEAWKAPETQKIIELNSLNSSYSNEFKAKSRELFDINDTVWIKQKHIEAQQKIEPLFKEKGKVIEICPNDSYIVKIDNSGKIIKKSHSQLKQLANKNFLPQP
ncbi:hypothetical protein ENBRE01_2401 [Enteropsectra breve]|nr:hypothetical protein ENBRE01_2401 [Enteropsectra breve]